MSTPSSLFAELEADTPAPASVEALLNAVGFDAAGLVPAIAQQHDTGEVLMLAWMNREALETSLASGRAVYYSRSRRALWHKGETSGNVQQLHGVRFDCDGDAVLLLVDQLGPACHTGRRSCFYVQINGNTASVDAPRLRDPAEMYGRDD